MSTWERRTFRAYLTYLGARVGLFLMWVTPDFVLYPSLRLLARVCFACVPRLRNRTLAGLERAFGDELEEREKRRIARAALCHFFALVGDYVKLPRRLRGERWRQYVDTSNIEEVVGASKAGGKGHMIISAHLGNWESGGIGIARCGFPLMIIARPIKNPYLNEWIWRTRSFAGNTVIPRRGGIRDILRELKSGRGIAMLADQNQRKRPIFVPFFGTLAATERSPAVLALRLGIPALVCICVRLGKGFRFRVEVFEKVDPPTSGSEEDKLLQMSADIQSAIERAARRHPGQYFWMHNRFRTRPEDRPDALCYPGGPPGQHTEPLQEQKKDTP